jgi:hypothetical protein
MGGFLHGYRLSKRKLCLIESPLLLHLRNQEWHVPGYWAIDVLMHRE